MQLRERIRAETRLQRLSWRLSWNSIPTRQHREIVREIRANLHEAAHAGQFDDAFELLGTTRELADAYLDALQPRPRWSAGILAAGLTLTAMILASTVIALAFAAGLDAAGAGAGRYELWPSVAFGGPLIIQERATDGTTVTATLTLLSPVHLAALLAAFISASRPWRRPHRRHQASDTDDD